VSQSLEDITKKYMTQPPASPTATSAPTAVKPSRALLDDALNRVEQSFQSRFNKPLRQTAGAQGLGGIHQRLYQGKAGDIGTHELSQEEGDWVVAQLKAAGVNVGDYRRTWRQIGGTAPHIHVDQPNDLMTATAKYLDKPDDAALTAVTASTSILARQTRPPVNDPDASPSSPRSMTPRQRSKAEMEVYGQGLKAKGWEAGPGDGGWWYVKEPTGVAPTKGAAKVIPKHIADLTSSGAQFGGSMAGGAVSSMKPVDWMVNRSEVNQPEGQILPGVGRLLDVGTRPFQYVSTLVAGLQRALGSSVNDRVTGGRVSSHYAPMDILRAAAERFYTGRTPKGYEQPVGEVYKLLTEKFGGDPNSTINQIAEGTIVGLTDPVSYIAPEVAAEKILGGGW
jgi:hypothetical protein